MDNEVAEFSEKMLSVLNTHNLRENKSYIITGYNCISMDVTLVNKKIGHFTGSIISHAFELNEPIELYQLSARTCGYIKNFRSFKIHGKTKVFCPQHLYVKILKMEHAALSYNGVFIPIEQETNIYNVSLYY